MKFISQIFILSLLNGAYRIENGLINKKSDAHGLVMCPLTYLPSPLTGILLHRLNQLHLGEFLIVDLVFDIEILRSCSSPCKLFEMLLLIFIRISMSERCFVEYMEVCCLMFPLSSNFEGV